MSVRRWGLTPEEWALAEARLLAALRHAARAGTTITYGEAALVAFEGRFSARSGALMDLLAAVDAEYARSHGAVIASLVVRKDTGMPGDGYFMFLDGTLGLDVADRRTVWLDQVARVVASVEPGAGSRRGGDRLQGPGLTWLPDEMLDQAPAAALRDAAVRCGANFTFVPGDRVWFDEAVRLLTESGIVPVAVCVGVLGRAAAETGWASLAQDSAGGFGRAGSLLEAHEDALRAELARAVASGATHAVIADDVVVPGHWLVDPACASDVVGLDGRAASGVRGALRGLWFHTDGDVSALEPDLVRAGFTGVHTSLSGIEFSQMAAALSTLDVMGGVSSFAGGCEHMSDATHHDRIVVSDDGGIVDNASLDRVARIFACHAVPGPVA